MKDFDASIPLSITKILNPDIDLDSNYTFYYDETNNIRKFYVREDDFNYSFHSNFVLGGVLYSGEKPNVESFFSGLDLQSTINEVKFKHIAKGKFLDCLNSKKLELFLSNILNSSLYIHYFSLNILYYSIVDIVDSAIANSEIAMQQGLSFANNLKNDLYKLCKLKIDDIIKLFYSFQYPNIKKDKVIPFINALIEIFVEYEKDTEFQFGLSILKKILKKSEIQNSLPFIMEEDDCILIKDFSSFYLRPIFTFKNAKHIFDNEESVKSILDDYNLNVDGVKLTNYIFEVSKTDLLIQVSDIIIGLVGKVSAFINSNTSSEIIASINNLNQIQLNNLDIYLDIINKSEDKNKAFFYNFDSSEELSKLKLIFNLRNKT